MRSRRNLAKHYKKSKRTYAKMRRSIRRSRKMVRGGEYTYDGIITKDVIYRHSSPETTEYITNIERAYLAKDFDKLESVLKRPNGAFFPARKAAHAAYKKLIEFPDVPQYIKTDLQDRITSERIWGNSITSERMWGL